MYKLYEKCQSENNKSEILINDKILINQIEI